MRNCTLVSPEFDLDVLAHFNAVILRHSISSVTFGFHRSESGKAMGEAMVALNEIKKKGWGIERDKSGTWKWVQAGVRYRTIKVITSMRRISGILF